jgi:dihydroorotate dehydrogenase
MIYNSFIKPILFGFDAEKVHYFSMSLLKLFYQFPLTKPLFLLFKTNDESLQVNSFGIKFKNPIGLAAGFDKNGDFIEVLDSLGFGFIEVGTVTPLPQSGNDKPRLFRLPQDNAIINRMGFNNKGVDYLVEKLQNIKNRNQIIIGGNIGKNKLTPNENAVDDYSICFEKLHKYVDYFVVNVSSPNTPNLRELQEKSALLEILTKLQSSSKQITNYKPILLKIAPDLEKTAINEIIEIVIETKIEGIIATNTTISRDNLQTNKLKVESIGNGGLSGAPLINKSVLVVNQLSKGLGIDKTIIGVGGIMNSKDIAMFFQNGASLIQLYTGFIYGGPFIVKKMKQQMIKNQKTNS